MTREVKVGLLLIISLAVLATGIFLVGERSNLFVIKNEYSVQFDSVGGLAVGNPVQLSGVVVGSVQRITLPPAVEEELLTVWISLDRRFAARVREDSRARIKTLGLLGDKYIELTSGSPDSAQIPPGGEIQAAAASDVERIITTGGDAVENLVAISYSLRIILERIESGKGVLGELTTDSEAGRRAKSAVVELLESYREISRRIETGEGTLARLINDRRLGDRMEGTLSGLEGLLETLETGDGALPALLNDPATRDQFDETLAGMTSVTQELSALAEQIRQGKGLLGSLMFDDAYSEEVQEDLKQLIENLRVLSERLEKGEGTLGMLINDPEIHDAINDIIVGIDESRLLRWLVRNRQKSGIKERYEEEVSEAEAANSSHRD